MLTLGKPVPEIRASATSNTWHYLSRASFCPLTQEHKRRFCRQVDQRFNNKPSHPKCGFCYWIIHVKFAASIHTMALMAVNRFCRIVKLANYRRYIYYQEENSISVFLVFSFKSLPYFLSGNRMAPSLSNQKQCWHSWPIGSTIISCVSKCTIFYCYLRILKTVRSANNNLYLSGRGSWRTVFVILWCF